MRKVTKLNIVFAKANFFREVDFSRKAKRKTDCSRKVTFRIPFREKSKSAKSTKAGVLGLEPRDPNGPKAPRGPPPRASPWPKGESSRVLSQGPRRGRAASLYRSLQHRYSCWRPSPCGLAPSYGLALRAAFGRTQSLTSRLRLHRSSHPGWTLSPTNTFCNICLKIYLLFFPGNYTFRKK